MLAIHKNIKIDPEEVLNKLGINRRRIYYNNLR